MLNYLKAFLVFLIWAIIALTTHYFITSNFSANTNSKEKVSIAKNVTNNYVVTNFNKDTIFSYNKPFIIQKNTPEIININDFTTFFNTIKSYLKNHYKNQLLIKGLYSEEEKDSSNFKNLGILRANTIKVYLKKLNINNYQLKTSSEIKNNLFEKKKNTSGVILKINKIENKTTDSIEQTISNKRIYVNFKDNTLITNKSIKNYTILLKQYIEEYPNKTIYITGHTDNNGYYQNNLIIGLNRANLVKNYFKLNGLENVKIITASKGESEPIADKNTLKGKAANRRIEIKIN
jgi:outer membrane protein OmpA-like peptidoglycan-associated protein